MSIASPPRPSGPDERSLEERVSELEALIEEARQRARRRRQRNGSLAALALLVGAGLYLGFVRAVPHESSAAATRPNSRFAGRSFVRNGPITLFLAPSSNADGLATIESIGNGKPDVIWQCPRAKWCGQPVSFAWSADGRRVAFTLDEIGGDSSFVGLHVVKSPLALHRALRASTSKSHGRTSAGRKPALAAGLPPTSPGPPMAHNLPIAAGLTRTIRTQATRLISTFFVFAAQGSRPSIQALPPTGLPGRQPEPGSHTQPR